MLHTLRLGAVAALLLATGCTSWMGYNEPQAMTKRFSFEANNFRVVASDLEGHSECAMVFPFLAPGAIGVGGIALGDTALYANAYADLREKARPHMENKAAQLHNVVEEVVINPNWLFYGKIQCKVTADVVEFTDEYRDYKTR